MPENTPNKTHSRRESLKNIGKIGVLASGAVLIGNHEINVEREGIKSQHARFFPLYEDHTIGPKPELIRDDFDVIVREGISGPQEINKPYFDIVGESTIPAMTQGIDLERIARNGTRFFFPDMMENFSEGQQDKADPVFDREAGQKKIMSLMINEGLLGVGTLLLGVATERVEKKLKPANPKISRSKLFRAGIFGVTSWAFSQPVTMIGAIAIENATQQEAVLRIAHRIHGLQSHAHPEWTMELFRNLLWTNKMFTLADFVSAEKGSFGNIGFNVGLLHTGVEDLLRAGPQLSRLLLISYPHEYLKHVVEINGGIENFCSSRFITFSKDFKKEDFRDKTKRHRVQEDRFLDKPLYDALKSQLRN
jgi:hypothetical protein